MPSVLIINGQRSETAAGMAKIRTMARYLPKMTEVTEFGEVRKVWSVFARRSSAMDLIVRIGTAKTKTTIADFREAVK